MELQFALKKIIYTLLLNLAFGSTGHRGKPKSMQVKLSTLGNPSVRLAWYH